MTTYIIERITLNPDLCTGWFMIRDIRITVQMELQCLK